MPKRLPPDHPFTALLRERMATFGLTDAKVAAALFVAGYKVGPSAVRAWRMGGSMPRDDMRGAVAAAIGASLTDVAVACAGHVVTPFIPSREW